MHQQPFIDQRSSTMKKRVSRNIRIGKYLVLPFVAIYVVGNVYTFFVEETPDKVMMFVVPLTCLIISLIGYFLFKYFDKAKTIEYDNNHLYVSDKFGMETVPLEHIVSLKMTTTKLNGNWGWKITYLDIDKVEQHASFFPRILNINMEGFHQQIKNKNPQAKIQRFSFGPFDIDSASN